MMRWTRPLPRLLLDGAMLICLVLAFAYWWLGNAAHEAIGTVFLIAVLRHVANNLFWWKGVRRGRMTVQRACDAVLGALLALAIVALLLTSLGVSRTLAQWLPMPRIFLLQEIHWFAAYWAIALAALHLGVNWNRITALVCNLSGLALPRWSGPLLWVVALAIAVQGTFSGSILGFWPRLRFSYALSMWDFNASVLPFFLHWAAALLTLAVAAHVLLSIATRNLQVLPAKNSR
ncbi:hypothetical protein BFP70_19745 [Thioclava sp. SK-1]|uniref:DUF4405 domain-containing protein n=1 Tax=Thioclava sp. SK-1 TaxID=1889770 RepID=UPI000825407E|nr:DUF4405 domain-containing protein [Thioclava sp. SK-1]OCX56647.1 hypothetical protein BFP70_19745 [Thioclava sp. SK-1]